MRKKAKILLVDDDVDFISATEAVLESGPYEIITAHTGDEGVRKARAERPDLILLDVIMPMQNGFKAAELIKKDPDLGKIPVIMLTGFSSKGPSSGIARGQGLTLAAEDYLEKPIEPTELLAKVKQYLGK